MMHRLAVLGAQITKSQNNEEPSASSNEAETLTVIDNRTGTNYKIKIKDETINATSLKKIRHKSSSSSTIPATNVGLKSYDPGYSNTCCCISKISYIDGDRGILRYRGYPIEVLAECVTFEEAAFLLVFGELPTAPQLKDFSLAVMRQSHLPIEITKLISSFRQDAHPMGILMSAMAALGTYHPESNPCLAEQDIYKDINIRNKQVFRILGLVSTLAVSIERHRMGRPAPHSSEVLGFTENFLFMMDQLGDHSTNDMYKPHPKLVRALDVLFVLHAEHELNCSTSATRHISSSNADVFTCIAGGIGALYGPRHGGANEAVVRMLVKIGSVENIPNFIDRVKCRKERLMGFGHRVYKSYDPRALIVRKVAEEVFDVLGTDPLIKVAMELEKVALNDDFFLSRKLYPNVDFYSGIIYKAMGFQPEFFPLLFAVPRCAGWLAHWYEFQDDPDNRIVRPFQIYKGYDLRTLPRINERPGNLINEEKLMSNQTSAETRRIVGNNI